MKKAIVFAVTATVLFSGVTCQAAETEKIEEIEAAEATEEVNVALDEVLDANMFTNIFKNYENVYVESRSFTDPLSYETVIVTSDAFYFRDNEREEYMTDGKTRGCYRDEAGNEVIYNAFNADGSAVEYTDYQGCLVAFNQEIEQIVSCTREGDELHLRTRVDAEHTKETLPYDYDTEQIQEGDYAEFEAVLDASTMEELSNAEYLVHVDGSRQLLKYTVMNFDVEGLNQVETFMAKLEAADKAADGTRVVTVVMDPGTEEEVTNTFEIPKGQAVSFYYDNTTYDVYQDAEGTRPISESESDYNADLTDYFIKK